MAAKQAPALNCLLTAARSVLNNFSTRESKQNNAIELLFAHLSAPPPASWLVAQHLRKPKVTNNGTGRDCNWPLAPADRRIVTGSFGRLACANNQYFISRCAAKLAPNCRCTLMITRPPVSHLDEQHFSRSSRPETGKLAQRATHAHESQVFKHSIKTTRNKLMQIVTNDQ